MSHRRMYFIKQILIFTKDLQPKESIAHMRSLAILLYNFRGAFVQVKNEKELVENINPQTLVVSDLDPATELGALLFYHGVAWMLSWENFVQYFSRIFYLKKNSDAPQVCLTFLESSLEKLLHDVFLLYGFQVHVANDKATLEKHILPILKNETLFHRSIDYFVFDIDGMGSSKKNKRDQIINNFRRLVKSNPYIAVSLVKNFSRGSVYDDIVHKIKEINNVILDAEEYSLFILQHLQAYRYAQFFSLQESPALLFSNLDNKSKVTKKKFSLSLRDGKTAYSFYMDKKNRKANFTGKDREQLFLRKQLTNWLKTYIQFNEEKKRRGSFTFVEEAVSETLLDTIEKMKKLEERKEKQANQNLLLGYKRSQEFKK